jgi:hypothetical protein
MTPPPDVGTQLLAEDIVHRPVGMTPHTLAAIIAASVSITAIVVGTWLSTINRIDDVVSAQLRLESAVDALAKSGTDDRYRGKDADRTMSFFRSLNADKYPDMKVPIPTSVRDGQVEVFK